MSGWEKRIAPVREASGLAHWTLHDLRRTFRSGLSALGIDYAVRELMLNHVVGDDLDQRYDRDPRWSRRVEAAERWAQHVLGIVARERRQGGAAAGELAHLQAGRAERSASFSQTGSMSP